MIAVDKLGVEKKEVSLIKDVSFQLQRGQSLGILGPNGAGKSTLLSSLGGLLPPTSGKVHIHDENVYRIDRRRRARLVAYLPQMSESITDFTAWELVMMARHPYNGRFEKEREEDVHAVEQAMERTCTIHLSHRRMWEVSGGERQRVLLAQAFAQQPELLLLDEPTTYLDVFHQWELLTILHEEQKKGLTWIAVLHDINMALQACDQILLLNQGKVCAFGPPEQVLTAERIADVFQVQATLVEVPHINRRQVVIYPSKLSEKK